MPPRKVHPTSMTTVSGRTISAVMSQILPVATTRISALFVISARFLVRELQLVTVAQALIAMSARGLPTMFDRPTMTTCFHSKLILYASRSFLASK